MKILCGWNLVTNELILIFLVLFWNKDSVIEGKNAVFSSGLYFRLLAYFMTTFTYFQHVDCFEHRHSSKHRSIRLHVFNFGELIIKAVYRMRGYCNCGCRMVNFPWTQQISSHEQKTPHKFHKLARRVCTLVSHILWTLVLQIAIGIL